jgi:hypothetical protein
MRKGRLALTLGVIGIIISGLLLAAGCTSSGDGGGSGGGKFEDLSSLARMAPAEATMMVYADMKTLMEDTDLDEMYEDMEDELSDASELGIEPDSVKHFGIIMIDYEEVTVVGADLDLDRIYAKLAAEDSEQSDYLGTEVWLGGYGQAMVILDDTLLMGSESNVQACLSAIDRGETAYDSNQDMRDVLGRMSDGVMMMIMPGDEFYPGSLYAGITIEKMSADNMKMRSLMKFADEEDAADVEEEINASADDMDVFNMSVSRSGAFVEFSAEIDIGEGFFPW